MDDLRGIRRRPTLPGRFQPSTISVLRLNFCVRDGNRWIPQAIVTGNQTEFGCLRCRLSGIVGSAIDRPPDFLSSASLQALALACLRAPGLGASAPRTLKTAQGRASFAPDQGALSALLVSSLPPPGFRFLQISPFRSSPRPISIIKLHTLPHFHR